MPKIELDKIVVEVFDVIRVIATLVDEVDETNFDECVDNLSDTKKQDKLLDLNDTIWSIESKRRVRVCCS